MPKPRLRQLGDLESKWLAQWVEDLTAGTLDKLAETLYQKGVISEEDYINASQDITDSDFGKLADLLEDFARKLLEGSTRSPAQDAKDLPEKLSEIVLMNAKEYDSTGKVPDQGLEDSLFNQWIELVGEKVAEDLFEEWVQNLPALERSLVDNYPL